MGSEQDDSSAHRRSTVFGPAVQRERLSEKVASSLLSAIIEKRLRPGDPLPSQRELGEQYGVSRTVIREAVGSLEARGVLEVRAGSGLRLTSVDASSVAESLRFFVRTSDVLDYSKVHEVRTMIETHCAELAATLATDSDVAAIRHWVDEQAASGEDLEAAARCDLEFHRAIAKTTGNELYLVLLDSIRGALLDIQRTLMPGRLPKTVREHRRVVACIAVGDGAGARQAMQQHLEVVQHDWRRRVKATVANRALPTPLPGEAAESVPVVVLADGVETP